MQSFTSLRITKGITEPRRNEWKAFERHKPKNSQYTCSISSSLSNWITKQFGQDAVSDFPLLLPLLRMKKWGFGYLFPSLCDLMFSVCIVWAIKFLLASLRTFFQKKTEKKTKKKKKKADKKGGYGRAFEVFAKPVGLDLYCPMRGLVGSHPKFAFLFIFLN